MAAVGPHIREEKEMKDWSIPFRTCKKPGCENHAAIGEAYCSREHAPLSHWNLEEEPIDEIEPPEPKSRKRDGLKRYKQWYGEHSDTKKEEWLDWVNIGYHDWNGKE